MARVDPPDRARLDLAQPEPVLQAIARLGPIHRSADDPDHLVDVVEGDEQPLDNVRAGFGLREPVAAPPFDHVELMGDVVVDHLCEVQRSRHSVDEGDLVDREVLLELGVFEEQVQDNLGIRILSQFDHQACSVPV